MNENMGPGFHCFVQYCHVYNHFTKQIQDTLGRRVAISGNWNMQPYLSALP